METYLKKGYSREWINQRLQAIQVRKELTDEWDTRGVQKGVEYAAIVYRYASGKYQLSADQLLAADVNGDGVVNTTDAALIYRVANGKLSKFPVEQ